MGGNAFVGGNASPAAEANILNDPEAADIVFGADCSIVMAGLDVTEQTLMTSADIARISTFDNPRAQHLAAIMPFYQTLLPRAPRPRGHLRPRLDDDQLPAGAAAVHLGRVPHPRRLRRQLLPRQNTAGDSCQRPRDALGWTAGGAHPHWRRRSRPSLNSNWKACRVERASTAGRKAMPIDPQVEGLLKRDGRHGAATDPHALGCRGADSGRGVDRRWRATRSKSGPFATSRSLSTEPRSGPGCTRRRAWVRTRS